MARNYEGLKDTVAPPSPPQLRPRRTRSGRPRSFRQHLLRRLIVIIPLALLMVFLMRSGLLDSMTDKLTFNKLSWYDNTALVEHLRVVLPRHRLTSLPGRCLVFIVRGDASTVTPNIEVLGRQGNGCPSPTLEAPPSAKTLFHVKVDRMARTIQTDAGNPGEFRLLP